MTSDEAAQVSLMVGWVFRGHIALLSLCLCRRSWNYETVARGDLYISICLYCVWPWVLLPHCNTGSLINFSRSNINCECTMPLGKLSSRKLERSLLLAILWVHGYMRHVNILSVIPPNSLYTPISVPLLKSFLWFSLWWIVECIILRSGEQIVA